ncbi:hypothetical protein ACFSE0_20770 [Ochrobactrum teleogrylli]|uniref:Uncharacterized protein n=1 Tax=Ochrobactrum teleogrylli TaxID=2479765 RepID=A0ABY2Y4K2_9HYPH|nr:hypothetical protein [[Ochrobactrum] teleogrylli]TNV13864.1 hypothetical protein FIC94_14765 [[Ochrobactrum] teleogrylli]
MDNPTLVAPLLPQAENGIIDVQRIIGSITVRVPAYSNIRKGDILVAFLDDVSSVPQLVPAPDLGGGYPVPFDLLFQNNKIDNGLKTVWYTVTDASDNVGTSISTTVRIINSTAIKPPPPTFPDARNGKLFKSSIQKNDGARIRATYARMMQGDAVKFFWSGSDASGASVPEASFESAPITIQPADVAQGYVESRIPATNVLVLGDGGIGTAHYKIEFAQPGDIRPVSPDTSVLISFAGLDQLTLIATQESGSRDVTFPLLLPNNVIKVYGPPKAKMKADVTAGARIVDASAPGTDYDFELNGDGVFYLEVYTSRPFIETKESINLLVYESDLLFSKSVDLSFAVNRAGSGGVQSYSRTTGAVADSIMRCSIWLIAERGVASINAVITGSAYINGWTQQTSIPVHADGTATINIISEVAQAVTLNLKAPGEYHGETNVNFIFLKDII